MLIRRILVPTDGSAGALEAAEYAAGLARRLGAEVTVLHVVYVPRIPMFLESHGFPERFRKEYLEEGRAIATITKGAFARAGVPAETDLREGDPGDVIREVAREGDYDLVVIGCRGLGQSDVLLFGSVVQRVVRSAPCPVLVVRSRQAVLAK